MKKPLIFLMSGALVATTAIGAGAYGVAHKTITLDIDGQATQVSTFSGSVAGVLEENGIVLADGDLVAPSANSVLNEGGEVVVRYQHEVTVEADGERETFKTTALDAEELLNGMESRGENVSLVASRSRGQERVDIGLRLNTDGPVALLIDGENTVLEAGHGEVEDILREQGIVLGDDDRISIKTLPLGATSLEEKSTDSDTTDADAATASNDQGTAVRRALSGNTDDIVTLVIQRVETKENTKSKKIKFESKTIKDEDRFADLGSYVKTAGKNGKKVTTYEEVWVDGALESSKKISTEVASKPVTKVTVVGTKERPKPVVTPKASSSSKSSSSSSSKSSSSSSSSSGSQGSAPTSGVWAKLAQCESGGNPSIVSSNGLYHGLYQFSVGTWKSVGGSGLPSQASAAEQTKRAQILQARSGWGQWPHCSAKLGLR